MTEIVALCQRNVTHCKQRTKTDYLQVTTTQMVNTFILTIIMGFQINDLLNVVQAVLLVGLCLHYRQLYRCR